MKTNGFVIGIDPDVEKSGVAVLDCAAREFKAVEAKTFPELVNYLRLCSDSKVGGYDVVVVIEDSDESRNWHTDYYFKEMAQSRFNPFVCKKVLGKAAAVGRNTGLCHATARHLKECAENFGLEVVMMKPLRKFWKGRDGKITHDEALYFMRGLPKQTNQEGRDAALLAWAYADYPIRVKS